MRHLTVGFLLAIFVSACKTSAPVVQQTPPATPAILTLGSKSFTTDDFFQSFTRNQLSADSAQRTDLKEYLGLYTNLKLKVLAAETEGYDTTEAFREEMSTYRKQLAQSYLIDKAFVESLAAEAYQRMQQEVNVSHILIPVPEYALPADTTAAYQKALDLRKQVLAGTDFAQLARTESKDATTAQNGGDLEYITVFSLVYPLETAAYTTPVGAVSQPIRSRFGYHLVKVNSRRPGRARVQVAHILVRMSPGTDEAGQRTALARIETAYARLQKGESFETVSRDVSDDVTSRTNGGVLPVVEPGRWVSAFEDAAYTLTKPGDYSNPVRTNYGWHIIKLIARKGAESYATLAPSLRQRVTTDSRADVLRQATVQRLRDEYAVQENRPVLEMALASADSSLLRGQWRYTEPLNPTLQNKPILTIAGQPYTVNQFFSFVQQRQQPPRNPKMATPESLSATASGSPVVAMNRLFDRFAGDQLIATAEANLDKKSSEFRALMNEIRDGVLLSQVMERNVWERSMADSTSQLQYYEQHKANYTFPERVEATILTTQQDSLLRQATTALNSKTPYQLRLSGAALPFAQNQTTLSETQRENLFEILAVLAQNPDYIIEVTGSHDATERDSVSAGRIRNVVGYLQKNGVSLSRIMEKDYQGARPGVSKEAQRNVTFQYFSNSRNDVIKTINSRNTAQGILGVTLTEGLFAKGDNPYVDALADRKTGTFTLKREGRMASITISRVEPARPQTFAEARGAVINDYQALLEKQWVEKLKQAHPVTVNEAEIQKLVK